jgi:Leucine-rich repeat (LRR) protein
MLKGKQGEGFPALDLKGLSLTATVLQFLALETNFMQKFDMIDSAFNNLSSLPDVFVKNCKARTVSFRHNQIEVIPDSFHNLTHLKGVSFNGNLIRHLDDEFYNLVNLTWLDLSNNQLADFSPLFLKNKVMLNATKNDALGLSLGVYLNNNPLSSPLMRALGNGKQPEQTIGIYNYFENNYEAR